MPRTGDPDEAGDPLCRRVVETFCSLYGAEAGNLALESMSLGGVLVCGNIASKMLPVLERGGFMKAFVDKAVSKYGKLDAIWANAGVSGGLVPLAEQTVEHWQEVLRINLIGPFLAIKYSMPHMIKQGFGAIVCTASVAGLKAGASGHPYGASKAGVISLVQTTAYSLSGTGVRINAVCPGLIETGMTKPVFDRAKERGTQDKIGQLNPLKRAGQPHELAAMGLFLASDEASYVNGQAIPVDGGLTASMPYTGKPI